MLLVIQLWLLEYIFDRWLITYFFLLLTIICLLFQIGPSILISYHLSSFNYKFNTFVSLYFSKVIKYKLMLMNFFRISSNFCHTSILISISLNPFSSTSNLTSSFKVLTLSDPVIKFGVGWGYNFPWWPVFLGNNWGDQYIWHILWLLNKLSLLLG